MCLRLFSAFRCMHSLCLFCCCCCFCCSAVVALHVLLSRLCVNRVQYSYWVCILHTYTHLKLIQCLRSESSWWMECMPLYVHKMRTLTHSHTHRHSLTNASTRTHATQQQKQHQHNTRLWWRCWHVWMFFTHRIRSTMNEICCFYTRCHSESPRACKYVRAGNVCECVCSVDSSCCYSAETRVANQNENQYNGVSSLSSWSSLPPPSVSSLLLLLLFSTGASKRYNRIHFVGK